MNIVGRSEPLFDADVLAFESELQTKIGASRVLVIGGAGTIGQALVRQLFRRDPRALHVVDISENNLVESVRDIRSSFGYGTGEFKSLPLDVESRQFDAFIESEDRYDYICNLSALKHVRSEKDPYTLMRMVGVNVFNAVKLARIAGQQGAKYFAVSTDKAANPKNLMGASKRIMEKFLHRESASAEVSTARIANVAFSDGSLLHGFTQRMKKFQPLSAPNDVWRYFVTPDESGELCMMSAVFGENLDTFFPNQKSELKLTRCSDVAVRFLENHGFEPIQCATEDEARKSANRLIPEMKWPVYFFSSDTTGEKTFEEFFGVDEAVDLEKFLSIGVIKNRATFEADSLRLFEDEINSIRESRGPWSKKRIVDAFLQVLPELKHEEKDFYLDSKM